ncbi:glycerophosphodiester phosphodiesterase [Streptomyces yaizuensis]|uniref:Glycerophosphodiester phosphodiesterase n=1 Tax=Streptomyces yaizuensis TaxID=2989713 RepID=A0ABQ5P7N1_9ACTN|nr:glycerophosphodiester phosphodiesterase family protein [Streptomyces sp. YSPA8]GLF98577.1 glycerophosphodiester phosphodiesterase [Streptomyces sp. YSPA8]
MYVPAVATATAAAVLGAGIALGPGPGPGPGTARAVVPAPAVRALVPAAHGTPLVIAHRGASAYAPENTLAAVDRAARMGFAWVENDVQRTRDGELVVVHDETLARTTDVEERFPGRAPWRVRDFTAAEIATLDAGGWFGPAWAGARVPTLAGYLRRVDRNGQKLLLEIKRPELYPGIERDTLRVLRAEGWLDRDRDRLRRRLVVQSFGAESLRTVHREHPGVVTGFLGAPPVAELPAHAAFVDQINPSHTAVTPEYVAAVRRLKGPHGKRLRVHTWTVNDPAAARRVAAAGVDGIITDRPDVVRDALARPPAPPAR